LIPVAFREIFQKSNIPILILDRDYNIVRINSTAKLFLNGRMSSLGKWSLRSFETFDPGILSDLAAKGEHEWCLGNEGKEQCFQVRMNTLYGNKKNVTGFTVYYQDITSQKNELKRMERYAEFDDLTKIRNRRSFFKKAVEEFDQAIVEKQKITVIMFDLDNFKEINDIYGHQAGDVVLQDMAALFKTELTETDLFARYGGEEFIIFERNRALEDAENLANRLCTLLHDHVFLYERHPIKTSASFGVAGPSRQIDKSLDRYIKEADEACYNAKSLGKHRVFVYSEKK
jgi:diguanylate cyclase (GGDEF)-like protein